MSAAVTKRPNVRRWLAWCEHCQDGYNAGTKKTADKWAATHNKDKHREDALDGA